jgi:signal transduction histidine kinase
MIQANRLIRRAVDGVISMVAPCSAVRLAVGRSATFRRYEDSDRESSCAGTDRVDHSRIEGSSERRTPVPRPGEYRPRVSRRNWALDITLAATVGLLGQLEVWWALGSTHRQGPLLAQSLLYAITALLLVGRRLRPLACLTAMVVVSVIEFVAVGSPEGFAVCVAPLIASYTVGSRLEWRRSWIGLVLSVVIWVAWAAFDPLSEDLAERLSALVWLTPSIIAWLLGALARASRLNAEQRSVNREQRASRAVAEERSRIARELHDVIGHSVSVMTVQASAVRRRLTPEQAVERQALESVESVGREALAEMRRMVGALRDAGDDHDLEPMPGLDQVDRLADKFREAGLPVSLSVTGVPRDLAPGLDLTAYRLVQEGLTNTLRHARNPHLAEVAIDYGPERIELALRDDGQRPPGSPPPAQAGKGLLGMRERVTVYGGSLVARVRPEGGFELVATLPNEPT